MVTRVNAAPMVEDLGTKDSSTRVVPQSSLEFPQHLPKLYIFAEKGPVGPSYLDLGSASLTQVYGDETFNVNKKYYTHQTPFLQAIASAGNNCMVHRLVAPDAKDVANVALYLDVLPTQVPLYVKQSDGSVELDSNGAPVEQKDSNGDSILVAGYKVAWVIESTVAPVGQYERGNLTQRNGLQVAGTTQSTQYPMFEFAAKDPGEAGNKLAVKLYPALSKDIVPFPSHMLNDGKLFPFYFQMVQLVDTLTGKTNSVLNSFGAQYSRFVSKKGGIDTSSGATVDMSKVLNDQYIDLSIDVASGLGTAYMYDGNIKDVLDMLYASEKNISDPYRDAEINNLEDNPYAINFFSFTSSNASPYQTMKLVDVPGSIRLTKNTNIFLSGSTDGTISADLLDSLVSADLENYNNNLHEYNDLVMYPESMMYDSGFTLETKKDMAKFISRRKDTFIVASTYAHDARSELLADQYSVGLALKTMYELYPESATFGTPVMRAVLVAGSGDLINSLYTERVPLTYEIAYRSARYMGASNGKWKSGFIFDRAPGSIISQLKNLDVTWVPASTRNTLWSVGLNFALNYKVNTQFFPAIQTVYENDTSVLNSYFVAVAISYLNKVSHAAWREFSGSISLTNAQLVEKVNEFVANACKDKFDGKFVIVPNATVTELDDLKGYSWTLEVKIFANNLKTCMSTFVNAFRMSDLSS